MNGSVDSQGRALLPIALHPTLGSPAELMKVWVDTGFTGDLVLPKVQIERLGLQACLIVPTTLADGSETEIESFVAWLDWFGELQEVEVCASSGQNTLLGVRLMLGRRLVVDYKTLNLTLE
jgi:predicted aspartyl protease